MLLRRRPQLNALGPASNHRRRASWELQTGAQDSILHRILQRWASGLRASRRQLVRQHLEDFVVLLMVWTQDAACREGSMDLTMDEGGAAGGGVVMEAASAAAASASASANTLSAPEIKKERLDTAAGTSSQNSTNASQSTSSASPTVVTAVKSEPDAGTVRRKNTRPIAIF